METLFNSPAEKEYFTQLVIASTDGSGKEYLLALHLNKGIPASESELRTYCDKVRVGETLKQSVERSLREGFNIPTVLDFEYTGQVDSAQNRFGETLPRYTVRVEVPYAPLVKESVIGLFIDWIEWDKLTELMPIGLDEEDKRKLSKQEEEIIQKLTELDYFKFDPPQILEKDKETIREGLRNSDFLSMGDYNFDESSNFIGGRAYPADEKDLFDGFISNVIKNMKPALEAEGVIIESVDEEITDDDAHFLTINGKKYEIYNVSEGKDEYYYWGIAHKRFIEIINELLAEAGSKEKLYGVGYGNDSYVIILTDELYYYIKNISIISDDQKPYSSEEKQME